MSILIYAIVFSYFTCLKHYTFSTFAWDLGIFNQAFYTTVLHGKLFYYSVENYVNTMGCYFAIHFSPILFTLIPFYAIYPAPETLLVAQSCILALGALPLYLIACEVLKDKKSSLVIALAYLLYPAVHGANWFDFHQQAFLPLLIFFSYYFLLKRYWLLFFFTLLTLMVDEYTSVIILVLSINLLLINNFMFTFIKNLKIRGTFIFIRHLKTKRDLVLTITLSISWLFFARYIKSLFPLNPTFRDFLLAIDNWKVLGIEKYSDPLISIPLHILLHPQLALEALLFDYHIKFLYLIFLFAPLLFIPFRSKLSLSALILLVPFLLSNYRPYYKIGTQYPLLIIPVIFLAFVDGLSKIYSRNGKMDLKPMLLAISLFIVSTSPLSPMTHNFVKEAHVLWYSDTMPKIDERVNSLHKLIALIPSNASILTQNHLFPHMSNRINAYAIPEWGPWNFNSNVTKRYLSNLMDKSHYVLLETPLLSPEVSYVLNEIINKESYGIYAISSAHKHEAILFKKGYNGEPLILSNDPRIFSTYKDLILAHGEMISDESRGQVACYPKSLGDNIFVFGPYTYLLPATYKIVFTIKVGEKVEGHIATLDVANNYGKEILAKRDLYGFELEPNKWSNVSLTLSLTKIKASVEFRILASGATDLYLDKVIVERVSSAANVDFGTKTFNYKDLILRSGNVTNGILFHSHNSTGDLFWYGPFTALPPCTYTAAFFIKISPRPESDNRILTLDVTYSRGLVLTKTDVNGAKMRDLGSGWYEVVITFDAEAELRDVEFRGLNPSPRYDIYMAYVLVEAVRK